MLSVALRLVVHVECWKDTEVVIPLACATYD